MKVYLESKSQVEALIGNKVGELEIFNGYWKVIGGFIFFRGEKGITEVNCEMAMEIGRTAHKSEEICVFMCDDYVSDSLKAVVVLTEMEDKS